MDRPGRPDAAAVLTRTVLSVEEYRAELLAELGGPGRPPIERVPVTDAVGRVLAAPALTQVDVPAFANSGMDGYAVRHADLGTLPAHLSVVADVPAGSAADPALGPGQCARIMTGAPVPGDADTIVPVESTDDGRARVVVREAPARGAFVRAQGSAIPRGRRLAEPGVTVDDGLLAALIATGAGAVEVAARPRVAVVSTGDELVAPGARLRPGQIHDVNSAYLAQRARRIGADADALPAVPDDPRAFAAAMDRAAGDHALVVVSGGASVGDHDVTRDVLGGAARGAFQHVRMQPGKPQGWARWGTALVVALPGNPLSAAVSFEMFVAPLVDHLLGRPPVSRTVRAVAGAGWSSPAGRRQFVPVRIGYEHARVVATPTHAHGSASHLSTALAGADGLAVVPESATQVAAGAALDIVVLR